jgi:hypothetical protein
MAKCQCCGQTIRAAKTKKVSKARGIAMGGRTFPEQRAWYDEAMRVKRGELVWSMNENHDRFGAPGGYVTPERADELAERRRELAAAPMSDVERRYCAA